MVGVLSYLSFSVMKNKVKTLALLGWVVVKLYKR